jgi:hypothetical protein
VLLTVFYFTVALPFGILIRLFMDPLRMKDAPRESAWLIRRTRDKDLTAVRRQF